MSSKPLDVNDDIYSAISVSNLSKKYHIYDRPQDRLVQGFLRNRKQLYKEFRALDDISLEIYRGETVGIVGLNGSGKSTLLQIIAGTLSPTEGTVRIKGKVSALLELGAGFNPEFSGRENVYLAASIMGFSRVEIERKYDSVISFADIGDVLDQPVKTYSSGMYVRLAFAVAISVDPEVLIVDEALSVGDMGFQTKCMVKLKQMQERGTTILFVSHDANAVTSLCQRAIYLRQGKMLAMGAASEITAQYIRDVQEASNRTIQSAATDAPPPERQGSEASILPAPTCAKFQHFEKMAANFRSGTGDARVMFAEMIDDNGSQVSSASFDQDVTIRIIVQATRASTFSVNYKICDKNRIAVIGADFLMQEHELLSLRPGQQAEVVYRTRLPLTDGKYSLRISLTHPIDAHQQAIFFDIVEIAHVFEMMRSTRAKFWTQIYVPNSLDVNIS
ncbi:ABC transporter ATP-binding protein [Dyella silvatica]|uniref:ABC transporter ATP-binding protein n=1 Tax=Dyella silvatica TaxID=2992128 RepID=UPI0022564D19|nr:ABC transporter ATP-binding protein [Dyella silvatica]